MIWTWTGRRAVFPAVWLPLALGATVLCAEEARRPVPSDADQQQARSLAAEVYEPEYRAAKTAEQKRALAAELMKSASECKADAVSYFVLLKLAGEVAASAGEVELSLRAVEQMIASYEMKGLPAKLDALTRSGSFARNSEQKGLLAQSAIVVTDEAVLLDEFPVAMEAVKIGLAAAREIRQNELAALDATSPKADGTVAASGPPAAKRKTKARYPRDAVEFEGHHYKVIWVRATWSAAYAACSAMGGRLACVDTAGEKAFLANLKGHGKVVWVGAQRVAPDAWKWIDGRILDVAELKDHTPPRGYDFVAFHASDGLNARPLHGHVAGFPVKDIQGFICEWE